jgi:hypothetical protein
MNPEPDLSLARHFASLPDPRVDRTRKHLLGDILIIALCATIAGADSWQEVERFGLVKIAWLRALLRLPNGIPSHDTLRRVFARIDPKAFDRCVSAWMTGLCEATGLRHVSSTARQPARPRPTRSAAASSWLTPGRRRTG